MRSPFASRGGLLALVALPLFSLGCGTGRAEEDPPVPQSTEELKQAIADVLEETKTPGAGVVLTSRDEVLWAESFGLADRASGRPVTPETMFRAGSISKSFTALALLKLKEAGKLRLDDRVRDLAGEDTFANPWEKSDPLLLFHLMEHTSGFDDIPLREFAASVPSSTSRESLAFAPRARQSRWRPGRFFSYSNANYSLAGHVVERASGRSFDEYLEAEILAPLGMKSATFLLTDAARENLATGYAADGVTEAPYEHILGRASGALNTTPAELAHLVQMLLGRGSYKGARIVRPESIERMETPTSTLGARQGMRAGYGLANDASAYRGFVFHGHGGAMTGYLAMYGYAPARGVGYVFMLNADTRDALERIDKLIRSYLAREWDKPTPPSAVVPDERLQTYAGYYEPHTPRFEQVRFLIRLLGVKHVAVENGTLRVSGLGGKPMVLMPADEACLFRGEDDPIATAAFVEEDGELYLVTGRLREGNLRRMPTWQVWLQGGAIVFCLVMMLSALLFPLVWVPRKLFGRMRGVRYLSVRLLPLLAVLCVVGAFVLLISGAVGDPFERLGKPSAWSVGFCALTWLFAVTTLAGLVQAVRARNWDVNRWVRRHALLVSLANVVVLGYLAYWGVIGMRTWA